MSITARIARHEILFRRMADQGGADLDLLEQQGKITPEALTSAILSCTGCLQPGPCKQHLDAGPGGVLFGCRNADLIERLARLS